MYMKKTDRILLLPNTCIIMHLVCVVVKLFQTKHEHIFLTQCTFSLLLTQYYTLYTYLLLMKTDTVSQ